MTMACDDTPATISFPTLPIPLPGVSYMASSTSTTPLEAPKVSSNRFCIPRLTHILIHPSSPTLLLFCQNPPPFLDLSYLLLQVIRKIGSGQFGVAHLLRDKTTQELFAAKYIERGLKIDENVHREIINHRSLRHPNIIQFKEVFLTPTHLVILMEYAAGGELFERIKNAGRFSEDEARFFFQQLISGVSYCHEMQICHRDLKLENTLLDDSPVPRLKICDFGYSKSSLLHSQPKSTVGTPAYIAPEILSRKEYDGKIADVWSCGVTLYVMLVGSYPFEDPLHPRNLRKSVKRILNVQYHIPDYVRISTECRDLLASIFVANPEERITIAGIKEHPWYGKGKQREEMGEGEDSERREVQGEEEIREIVKEAMGSRGEKEKSDGLMWGDELEWDTDVDGSREFVYGF